MQGVIGDGVGVSTEVAGAGGVDMNPTRDTLLQSVQQISAGYGFNCGVFTTVGMKSKVVCWGINKSGQTEVPDFDKI